MEIVARLSVITTKSVMHRHLTRKRALRQSPATAGPHHAPPTVELIKIGDAYAVRDGHHRTSVAWALGEEFIDAQVTACELVD